MLQQPSAGAGAPEDALRVGEVEAVSPRPPCSATGTAHGVQVPAHPGPVLFGFGVFRSLFGVFPSLGVLFFGSRGVFSLVGWFSFPAVYMCCLSLF